MTTAFVSHPSCSRHEMGGYHPECPERLAAIHDQLRASGVGDLLVPFEALPATDEQLERVHPPEYLAWLDGESPSEGYAHLDPDTAINPHSLDAARHAAGAVVLATDLVVSGSVHNAFCSVRPPGHHAEQVRAMGFCILNNVAVGVTHALTVHGLRRVAIVDFDVHHGNGTEQIFAGHPQVLMVSTFQYPLYPYSGIEALGPNMVNVPLPGGSDGTAFREAVTTKWLPALEAFEPDMIFISAGFDAHREDPLANLNLVEADYAWVTRALVAVAHKHAQGRIVSSLEGGYALSALGRSVVAHVRELVEA
jgi:acetoin utilization deacetylase AcuC-like enzyme